MDGEVVDEEAAVHEVGEAVDDGATEEQDLLPGLDVHHGATDLRGKS